MKKRKCLNCGNKNIKKIHENVTHNLNIDDSIEEINLTHEFISCNRCGFTVENKEYLPKKYQKYFRNLKGLNKIKEIENKIMSMGPKEFEKFKEKYNV